MNKKNIYIIVFCIILMILNFKFNLFCSNGEAKWIFENFQLDSEDLVIASIVRDKYKLNENKFGLQLIKGIDVNERDKYINALENKNNIQTVDYKSQVGVHGFIFSFLYNKLHIPFGGLQLICCSLLAVVLIVICSLLKDKYGKLFAIIFYIVFLMSPWIVNFAKNLYWIEFSWFLPAMFALLLDKTKNKKLFLPLIFLSVLFKCLCGYEYLSTILLFSISFYIVDFIADKSKRKESLKNILLIGFVSVAAFIIAIGIHGLLRGNGNLVTGIKAIYEEDIKRRTISSDYSQFENVTIQESIKSSYIQVLKKYLKFNTDIIFGVKGVFFPAIVIASFVILVYNSAVKQQNSTRDFAIYCAFALTSISWFVLGKAHSYIHTHMNFVLWYFGFVQICIYVIVNFVCLYLKNLKKEIEKWRKKVQK